MVCITQNEVRALFLQVPVCGLCLGSRTFQAFVYSEKELFHAYLTLGTSNGQSSLDIKHVTLEKQVPRFIIHHGCCLFVPN